MTIIQTFMTAPMSVDKFKKNILIAALSLAYAHKSGYKVKMYTDNLGALILGRLPYDELNVELNDLELPESNALWSIGKYYALMKEPLGTIHTDFDVILKKPCLEGLFNGANAVAQIKENIGPSLPWYEQCRQFLMFHNCNDDFDLSHPVRNTYNVGIIGYSNEKMRQAHVVPILNVYEKFKNYKNQMPVLDFFIEQANLYELSTKGFKVNTIIKNHIADITDYNIINQTADDIGYCHLLSKQKYATTVISRVVQLLLVNFPNIYNSIKDIVNITKV